MDMMVSDLKSNPIQTTRRVKHVVWLVPLLAIIALFLAYRSLTIRPPAEARGRGDVISASALEERYGMRVNLIGVTAAGGLVDLRLKIVNGEKAKSLLQDPVNFPALDVGNGVILNAPPDTKSEEIRFEDNSNLFVLFPNARNAVKPGTPVAVVFGKTALEPIIAK